MPTPANASNDYKKEIATIAGTTFNVKHYGATGNGSTDDTANVQAALDAAEVAGGAVFFPAGTYMVTGLTYNSAHPVHIYGESTSIIADAIYGSIIKLSQAGTALALSTIPGNGGSKVSNLSFDGGSISNGIGIEVLRNHTVLDNCQFNMFNTSGTAIKVGKSPGYTVTCSLLNCKVRKATTGVLAVYTTSLNIIGGYYADGTTGIDYTDSNNDTLCCLGVNLDSYTGYAINVAGDGARIIGCRLESNGNGMNVTGTNNSIIGNYMIGNSSGTGLTIGAAADNIRAMGNTYSSWTTFIENNNPTNATVFDLWPAVYDQTNASITLGDIAAPQTIEAASGHCIVYLDAVAGHRWRLRSRSDQFFDFYDDDTAKYALTFNPAGFPQVPSYTVATVPSGSAGGVIYVSDGAAGSPCLAFYDTGWKRCDTLAAISAT
jgi:hypothetical protein